MTSYVKFANKVPTPEAFKFLPHLKYSWKKLWLESEFIVYRVDFTTWSKLQIKLKQSFKFYMYELLITNNKKYELIKYKLISLETT